MYDIQWEILYFPNYPSKNGDQHVFFSKGTYSLGDGGVWSNLSVHSMHNAENCLIDHQSRLSDVQVSEDAKFKAYQDIWYLLNLN
jgi:hypothetical protein